MSLPPGFLDELRTRLTLSDVVGRKVVWDRRKSQPGKGDLWAPCPFHHEKTASFHVDDKKGFYYCFGCHAKGDAISFVKDTENVGFMEAVEILAGEAGLQMPARDPRAKEKADRHSQLFEVMELAVSHFRLMLKTAAGAEARAYLAGRGLDEAAQERWGIGFAPDLWQGLWDHLKGKGVADDLILAAGLAKPSQKGGKPYDTFRGRIMFPIRDGKGRCIAFGGRAMDPNDSAKYLNSPETALFDKGRNLYNIGPARAASGKGKPLVVAEGYMDVIALSEAGFKATVAPLGTAITEDQLRLMWRISDEPVIALDGDAAGQRAANRLISLALPMLQPGKSLRFSHMPAGMDPDDVLRSDQGVAQMEELLKSATPLVRKLWDSEVTEPPESYTPEQRAAVDKRLNGLIAQIPDGDVKRYYAEAIKQFRWEYFRPRDWAPQFRAKVAKPRSLMTTRASLIAQDRNNHAAELLREMIILAVLIQYPEITAQVESDLERLEMLDAEHERLLMVILENFQIAPSSESLKMILAEHLGAEPVERLMRRAHVEMVLRVLKRDDTEFPFATLMEQITKLETDRGLRREIEDAIEDMEGLVDEGLTWRIAQATEARHSAMKSQLEDKTTFERAANGLLISREEKDVFEQMLAGLSVSDGKKEGS